MAGIEKKFDTQAVKEMDAAYMMHFINRLPVVFVRGAGMKLWDTDGKEYLDFLAGIGVIGLGHCHPDLVAAISAQAAELMHVSNLYYTAQQAMLGKRLVEISGMDRAFFCNSGAEANEAAIKLARKWAKGKHGTNRHEIITFTGSFHGRTMATVTATAQPKYHEGFQPMLPGFKYVAFNDLAGVEAAITDDTCAIMFEPVQGESGVYPASQEFMTGVRKLCDEKGLLLILDEVQSGLGRTGKWFGHEHYGVKPDIMTLAKTLGGGFPVGACLCTDEASVFVPGNHSSTFGGNPLACAAALAALDIIEKDDLVRNSAETGAYLKEKLLELQSKRSDIREVRGVGLMCAVEFTTEIAADLCKDLLSRGLIVNSIGNSILRMLPPLICSKEDVDVAVGMIAESIQAIS